MLHVTHELSWSWSHGSLIYNNLCNQSLLPLMFWSVVDATLCEKVCQWLAIGRWLSSGAPVSSTNKTNRHDITQILFKVALSTVNHTKTMNYIVSENRVTFLINCTCIWLTLSNIGFAMPNLRFNKLRNSYDLLCLISGMIRYGSS